MKTLELTKGFKAVLYNTQEFKDKFCEILCPVSALPTFDIFYRMEQLLVNSDNVKIECIEDRKSSTVYRLVFTSTNGLDYEICRVADGISEYFSHINELKYLDLQDEIVEKFEVENIDKIWPEIVEDCEC